MSDTSQQPSNGKVYLPFTVGETIGRPLREWAYKTATYPRGIKRTDVALAPNDIQFETALAWFNNNFEPATGSVFGFGSEGSTASGNVGFDSGNFLDAVHAISPLLAEFDGVISSETLGRVAAQLNGIWSRRPPSRPLNGLPSRAKALLPGDFSSEFSSRDFVTSEWAYITSDYPDGIRTSQLGILEAETQIEVMRVWLFANYKPVVTSTIAEQQVTSDFGSALDLLRVEFSHVVGPLVLESVAQTFGSGYWQRRNVNTLDAKALSLRQLKAAALSELNALEKALGEEPEHGEIGHNSQGLVLPPGFRVRLVGAFAAARLAIRSNSLPALLESWEVIGPALGWIRDKVIGIATDFFKSDEGKIVRSALIFLGIGYVGYLFHLWDKADGVQYMINLLTLRTGGQAAVTTVSSMKKIRSRRNSTKKKEHTRKKGKSSSNPKS